MKRRIGKYGEDERHQVIKHECIDEDNAKPVLMLSGWRYGIENRRENIARREGRYVCLTRRRMKELEHNNKRD